MPRKKKYKINKLPSKPSALILVALDDLRKVEKDKRYGVDMNYWHTPASEAPTRNPKPCTVCFAGSVIACESNVSIDINVEPENFSPSVCKKLRALNELRKGDFHVFLKQLDVPIPLDGVDTDCKFNFYCDDRPVFFGALTKFALQLERAGY